MLNLPTTTKVNKPLPKKAIYQKFHLKNLAKERFDADISRIVIVNELSKATVSIEPGKEVSSIFVLQVLLKKRDFDPKNVQSLSRLIPQKILFVLTFEDKARMAVLYSKLHMTDWVPADELSVDIKGLSLDAVWENIIKQVGGINVTDGNTLAEQIESDEHNKKLSRQIDALERKARTEKQPKKKFDIVKEIRVLQQKKNK